MCPIQWLYLAAHGCKTNLNLNLNPELAQLAARTHSSHVSTQLF
jgi:hypothetical protein